MTENVDALARLPQTLADRYRLDRELGRGGMAIVFLAEDIKHHRQVALKILQPDVAAAIGPARFLQEIQIAASLTHPNLLPLYDSGESNGTLYYVMPYVEGETLRERLVREKQLTLEDATGIIGDVAAGVQYAHEHGIVHRDIKPENILLQSGRALVADFGIARAVSRSARQPLTSSGVILGTAQYMSPEQAMGDDGVGVRSDIYSIGCVFYEMLAGEAPYTGPTVQAILTRHAIADIPSVRIIRPDVPVEIDEIIEKALGKVPASRQQSAAAFAHSVRSYRPDRRKWLRGKQRLLAIGGLAAAAAIVGTLVLTQRIFAHPLEQNDWLLAADFAGPPNDRTLAPAFRDLVTTALGQSQFVRVIERRQLSEIMRQAGIPETSFVDLNLARQLAQRGSVRAVLVGSITPLGNGYSAVLHVVSADDGKALASVAAAAPGPDWQHGLINVTQNEVGQLRAQLGERRSAIAENRPLRDVATPSFDAFRYYSEAMDGSIMRGDFTGANRLLDRAIQLDSGFAAAWASRAMNFLTERQLDSARLAYNRALSLPARLSVADTYRLRGDAAYAIDHDVTAAVRWYDLYLAEVPQSRSGRSNRSLYRAALGQYDKAEADLREAIAMNPFGPELIQPVILNLAAVQVVRGHLSDARETSSKLTGPFAQYMRILLASATAQWPQADSAALVVLAKPGTQGLFHTNAVTAHASALAGQGSIFAADSVLRDAVTSSKGSPARWYERARLLMTIAAGRTLGPAALSPSDTSLAAEMLRGLWAAQSGDTIIARAKVKRMAALSARDLTVVGSGPILIDGWIALHAGRFREVIDRIAPLATTGEQDPTILDRPDSFMQRWLVAIAYDSVGKPDSAARFLQLMIEPTGIPPAHYALRGITYGFAHHALADIARRTGDARGEAIHRDALRKSFARPDRLTAPFLTVLQQRGGKEFM